MKFLWSGVKGRKYEVWIDRLMPGGADWNPEIEARLRACDIFILLVSAHSTGSDYIIDKEIPIVRERQKNADGVYFYPLLLDWTPKEGLAQVNDKNLRPRDAKPFSSLSPSERSRQMSEAADEIADIAKSIAERKSAAAATSADFLRPGEDRDGRSGAARRITESLQPSRIARLARRRLRLWSPSAACPRLSTSAWSGATRSLSASTKPGATKTPTSSRSSPRAARASRRWSTNG